MRLLACCALLFLVSNRCSHGSMIRHENETIDDNQIGIKCLESLLDTTIWDSHSFVIIFDHDEAVTDTFFQGNSNFSWRFVKSTSKTVLSGFTNVILYMNNFESLNETLSSIDIHRVDTYAKLVVRLRKRFTDVDEIRRSSTGTADVMWNLDRTRVVYLVPCGTEILVMRSLAFAKNCRPGELEVLDVWTENGFQKNAELFPAKILEVNGCVQNYSLLLNDSSLLQGRVEITETGETVAGGVGARLASIIAEKMNMVLHLLPEAPQSLEELHDQIKQGESLFSMAGNVPVAMLTEDFDYIPGYMEESVAFGYINGDSEVSWKNLIWPLTSQVWAYTGCTLILFSGLVVVANRYHRRKVKSDKFGIIDSLGMLFGNPRSLPRTGFMRYLAAIWICYSYLMDASYSCGLVSFLTKPKEKRVLNTLEELLAAGIEIGGGNVGREFYNDPSDPIMKKIYDQYQVWSSTEINERLIEGHSAVHIFTSTLYIYNTDYSDKLNHQLRMLKEKACTFHAPILMRKRSPLADEVLFYALQAVERGLPLYWLHQYTRKPVADERFGDAGPMTISMMDVRGIFCLHGLLLTCSFVVFLAELIFHKHFSSPVSKSKDSVH